MHIQPRDYHKNFVLIREGEIPKEIIFIEKGKIACGIEFKGKFYPYFNYKGKSIVGDISVINKSKIYAQYICSNHVTGFAIPGRVVRQLFKLCPNHKREFSIFSTKNAERVRNTLAGHRKALEDQNDEEKECISEEAILFNKKSKVNTRMTNKRNQKQSITKKKHGTISDNNADYLNEISKTMRDLKNQQEDLLKTLKENFSLFAKILPKSINKSG